MYFYLIFLILYFRTNPSFFNIFPMVLSCICIPFFCNCQCIFKAHNLSFFLIEMILSFNRLCFFEGVKINILNICVFTCPWCSGVMNDSGTALDQACDPYPTAQCGYGNVSPAGQIRRSLVLSPDVYNIAGVHK